MNSPAADAFVAKLDVSDLVASNHPPVANAGLDQSVNEAASVTLDGSGKRDPDGDSLTYTWEQIAGTSVVLNLSDPVHANLHRSERTPWRGNPHLPAHCL